MMFVWLAAGVQAGCEEIISEPSARKNTLSASLLSLLITCPNFSCEDSIEC